MDVGIKRPQAGLSPAEEALLPTLDSYIDSLEGTGGALIPILQQAQELFGYLPDDVLRHVSRRLSVPYSEVAGVVTFYSYFSTVPRGRTIVRVCLGTACYVRGGRDVLDSCRHALGIDVGETTGDREYSLEVGRCFGACGLAPVVMVNDDVHQRVKPSSVKEELASYRSEQPAAQEESDGSSKAH